MKRASETVCLVLGGGRGTRLHPLTRNRSKPAVPLGGKYRLIDVPISNCLNSGLNRIYVLTQYQSASLNEHMKAAYSFDRFGGGFVEVLAAEQRVESETWYQGTADAVRQNLMHLGSRWREVLILSGDQLYQMNFQNLIKHHRESGAAMSIAVLPVGADMAPALGILQVDNKGRVVHFHEKPAHSELGPLASDPALLKTFGVEAPGRPYLASMGIYLFDQKVLFDELNEFRHVDFGRDLFPACIRKHKVQTFVFDGYWEDIGTVASFHEANLLLAKSPAPYQFFGDLGITYTRPRTLPVTQLGKVSIRDAIVAEGCRIESADLEESIVGIRSILGANVTLRKTIVMGADYYESSDDREDNRRKGRPNVGIGSNVIIEHAIVDKNARIGDNVIIRHPPDVSPQETEHYSVRDGVICIYKDAIIPNGTRIGS
ncbi:MAG: glucose-1-phosphate adenylyltransferase [Myxococcales bacterium]